MVTLLITSALLLGLFVIAIYFWQKPENKSEPMELSSPTTRSLFESDPIPAQLVSGDAENTVSHRTALLQRAAEGDKSALLDANQAAKEDYNKILNVLITNAGSSAQLLSLVSYVTGHELSVNKKLANAVIKAWEQSADRGSTAKMLHIAALADDAETYRRAVELCLGFWREGRLPDLSAVELQALLSGEFWVLSSGTRKSGAGFVLKRTLSAARRELERSTTN